LAAAIDGPLAPGLPEVRRYRSAEQILTRAFASTIGKPGQSSSPNGIRLNRAANQAAHILNTLDCIGPAEHAHRIDPLAIVEAFPTAFIGSMLEPGETSRVRSQARSDTYFEVLTNAGACRLSAFAERLLRGRRLTPIPRAIRNHDDRAAFVCALTALAIVARKYTAVGDDRDGWIIMPPIAGPGGIPGLQRWAKEALDRHSGASLSASASITVHARLRQSDTPAPRPSPWSR
jgi:hypothetical protein